MKKGILRALIVAAAVASLASCAWISELITPIEGTWTTTITYPTYGTFEATFTLARDGSTTVNGSLTAASSSSGAWPGTLPVSFTGTIDGTAMNLPIELSYSSGTYTYKYDITLSGTVSGSSCSGTSTLSLSMDGTLMGTDSGTFTASKS